MSPLRAAFLLALLWQVCVLAAPNAAAAQSATATTSLWSSTTRPATAAEADTKAVELGVKFRPSVDGQILGVRFYKGTTALGTYRGSLWSAQGTRLAQATFSTSAATGWQEVRFATPVAVKANTTYVASYYSSIGRYAVDQNYFAGRSITSGQLTALADGTAGGNGLYLYGSGFPTSSYRASNYWVDVVFQPGAGTPAATPTAPPATPPATPTAPPATPTAPPATPTTPPATPTIPSATATPTTPTATKTATSTPTTPSPTSTPATPTPTPTQGGPLGSGYTTVGALTLKATYQSIGVYANFSGDADADNRATLEYRRVGDSTWKRGMDMTVDRRESVSGAGVTAANPFKYQWRASILMTEPGVEYDVRVTFTDPDGVSGTNPAVTRVRTRSDAMPTGGATFYVAPNGADSNPGTAAAPWHTLQKAGGAVNAGDTVVVRAGTYAPFSLSRSGTASQWVDFKAYDGERPQISAAAGSGTLVNITGSYVRFRGFELVGGKTGVVVGGSAREVVVEGNVVRGQPGIAIQIGGSYSGNAVANVTVQDNDVRADTTPEPQSNIILVQAAAGGHVIRRNKIVFYYPGSSSVHGTDCIGGSPNFDPRGGFFADTDVNDNFCDGATDEGIEIDGGNANIRIWGNTITRANVGFSITPVYYGPVYVFRNVVHKLQDHWVGECIAVKDGESGTGAVFFYHNTFYSPSGAGCNNLFEGFAKGGSGQPQINVVIKNNIFHFWGRIYATATATDKTADYNLTYVEPASGDKVAKWAGKDYYSWATFVSATGQERNGVWGKASFANAAGGDFHLVAGSAGVDRATPLAGFNGPDSPWANGGSGADMGAFEYSP